MKTTTMAMATTTTTKKKTTPRRRATTATLLDATFRFLRCILVAFAVIYLPSGVLAEDSSGDAGGSDIFIDRTFNSSLVLTISPNVLDAPDAVVTELSQLLVESYNEWRGNFFVFDPYQRVAISVIQVVGLTEPNGFTYSRQRRHLSTQQEQQEGKTSSQPNNRKLQDDSTSTSGPSSASSTSDGPTSAPSIAAAFDKNFNDGVNLLFEISGSCSDCPPDLSLLSDDVLAFRRERRRRSLEEDETASTTLSPEDIIVSILTNKLVDTQSDLVVYDLNEAVQKSCPAELDVYLVTATIDLETPFVADDVVELERAFVDSYNRLYTRYCDQAFQQVIGAHYVSEEQITLLNDSDSNNNNNSTLFKVESDTSSLRATRYTFDVEVVCRDCITLFSSGNNDETSDVVTRKLSSLSHSTSTSNIRGSAKAASVSGSNAPAGSSSRFLDCEELDQFFRNRSCYCNIEPIADRPPTREEFEEFFLGRLERIGLLDSDATWRPTPPPVASQSPSESPSFPQPLINISLPEDCDDISLDLIEGSNFTSTIVVTVSSDILNATGEDLDLLGQTFLAIFNRLNVFNEDLCDPNNRFVFSVTVKVDFAFSRRTLYENTNNIIPPSSPRFQALRRREVQEVSPSPSTSTAPASPSISTAPSASPSDMFQQQDDYVDLLFTITGSCSDCEDDLNLLSDDVVARRHLVRRNLQQLVPLVPDDASCFCSPDAEPRPPTADELLSDFSVVASSTGIVSDVFLLVEVDPVSCSDELVLVESLETLSIDVAKIFGDGATVTTSEIEEAFVCSYNQLATQNFCDPAFATITTATCVTTFAPSQPPSQLPSASHEPSLLPTQSSAPSMSPTQTPMPSIGDVMTTFTLAVTTRCRNCTSLFSEEIFSDLPVFDGNQNTSFFGSQDNGEWFASIFGRDNSRKHNRILSFFEGSQGQLKRGDQCYCPVGKPQRAPTQMESESAFGTCLLTNAPTPAPTRRPTREPREDPVDQPTDEPVEEPTDEPAEKPTDKPTDKPTEEPNDELCDEPIYESIDARGYSAPSEIPTNEPTVTFSPTC